MMMVSPGSDISDVRLASSEIVALADRITTVNTAYGYLTENTLPLDQVEYLLNFQAPLEVVVDRWPSALDGLIDMEDILWDICDRKDGLQGDYPLMTDNPCAVLEVSSTQPAPGKPSLLAGLREAAAKADPPKDHPPARNPGPEL